jgi:hypothetical protein
VHDREPEQVPVEGDRNPQQASVLSESFGRHSIKQMKLSMPQWRSY